MTDVDYTDGLALLANTPAQIPAGASSGRHWPLPEHK